MISCSYTSCLLLACIACLPHAIAEEPASHARPRVEFRRAENTPAAGLTEAAVLMPPRKVYLHAVADATDHDIAEARTVLDRTSSPAVLILFTKDGAKKMERLSNQHQDRPLAIIVDGRVIVAPELRTTLSHQAMITGNFTQREIDAMVAFINSGDKPAAREASARAGRERAEQRNAADSR